MTVSSKEKTGFVMKRLNLWLRKYFQLEVALEEIDVLMRMLLASGFPELQNDLVLVLVLVLSHFYSVPLTREDGTSCALRTLSDPSRIV